MTCYFPLTAWKPRDLSEYNPATGKAKLVFNENQGFPNTKMEIPCGQCIGCRLDRARAWAVRCMHEASLHKDNCFVTLTYSDQNLPDNSSLDKSHMVKFMKRLRKRHPDIKIRFFQCGEYGEKLQRPHHHILLFGYSFPDKHHFSTRNKIPNYLSLELSDLWPYGQHSIGEITYDSACYTARYVLKKVTGKTAEQHYNGRTPEYTTMSRNPGIGRDWYEKYHEDIYSLDHCIVTDSFQCRPPIYYDRLFDNQQPSRFANLKAKRREKAKNNPERDIHRLATKHQIQQLKQSKIERSYEAL